MLNKIDKSIINKIYATGTNNRIIPVIIYVNKKSDAEKLIEDNNILNPKYLSMLSCLIGEVEFTHIFKLSKLNEVRYIADSTKVCAMMYASKKFIGYNFLYEKIPKNISKHSVAIIDTGISPHIDFLIGRNRIIKFVDLINNREDIYDDNGHGTFISGVLSAGYNTQKYAGIDTISNIIVIKALDGIGETTSIKILEAMQWVLDNKEKYSIDVVCMSFGTIFREGDALSVSAEILWNNGITVVSAGGNSGPEESTIMSPGASRKIITVGSLDKLELSNIRVADFSSRGPVGNYYKPDLLLPGVDIVSVSRPKEDGKMYTDMSGTSVSTPMVAGVASLLKYINPKYTPDQIKYMLISACVKITGDRNVEGFGRLDLNRLKLL